MKRFFSRIVALFVNRKIWVRQIVVASLAAGAAWLVGEQAFSGGGLVAAIVCSLSIRISLYKSVREGLGQILGTAIGFIESFGADPADKTSTRPAPREFIKPAAICERPALWTHTNRTAGLGEDIFFLLFCSQ